ncbi:hypothetical protein AAFF_G00251410 [Aldrovandia affinis]|uniref:Leucine-rich repeat-containing protein 7 n=1 Tax=Aldrovandia affinis TaxID=143900 RepID=A0AAD7RCT5_9TELE|nr:hypothetical protein AAFF_G00251410 [Aldrovandia affinis]
MRFFAPCPQKHRCTRACAGEWWRLKARAAPLASQSACRQSAGVMREGLRADQGEPNLKVIPHSCCEFVTRTQIMTLTRSLRDGAQFHKVAQTLLSGSSGGQDTVQCLEMTTKRKIMGRLVPCRCFRGEEDVISVLDYSHCSLQQVPKEIFNFERTLEELYLDANQIEELPKPDATLPRRRAHDTVVFVSVRRGEATFSSFHPLFKSAISDSSQESP